jgi:hypothetical protein
MVYFVRTVKNNGYRCCCHNSFENTVKIEDRAEAISVVPLVREGDQWGEIEEIDVTDGSTGQIIAEGKLEWVSGRGYYYTHYHWYGQVDNVPFDDLHGLKDNESTWSDIIMRTDIEKAEKKIKQLELDIAAKTKELETLKSKQK